MTKQEFKEDLHIVIELKYFWLILFGIFMVGVFLTSCSDEDLSKRKQLSKIDSQMNNIDKQIDQLTKTIDSISFIDNSSDSCQCSDVICGDDNGDCDCDDCTDK